MVCKSRLREPPRIMLEAAAAAAEMEYRAAHQVVPAAVERAEGIMPRRQAQPVSVVAGAAAQRVAQAP